MKHQLKKILLLYLLTGTLFVSCTMEEEAIRNHNYSKEIKIYQKSFDELIKDSKFATSFNKLPKKKSTLQTSTQARTVMEEQYGFTITNTPARVMQVGKITSYTFHIERENSDPTFFENLVIQNDSIGNTTAHIIKYTPFMPMTAFAEHNSYGFEGETEFTSIIYDDTQANTTGKIVTDCRKLYGFRCTGANGTSGSCGAPEHIPMGQCTTWTPDCIKYTFITQTCTTYDDGQPGDGTGGGGTGGGTGTGGGGSTDPVYSDPVCGSGCISEEGYDPCTNANTAIANANALFNSPEVQQGMNDALTAKLNNPATNNIEWAVGVGQTSTGFTVTPAVTDYDPYSSTIPVSQVVGTYVADGHIHPLPGVASPSAGDLYGMLNTIQLYPERKYRFTFGGGGANSPIDVYVLIVTDSNAAQTFLNEYPKSENYDNDKHSFKRYSKLGADYYNVRKSYGAGFFLDSSNEVYNGDVVGMAYVLDKYNSGMCIAKKDANGNLKKINATLRKTTNVYGEEVDEVIVSKCQ